MIKVSSIHPARRNLATIPRLADITSTIAVREAEKAMKEVEIKKQHHAVVSDKLQNQKAQLVSQTE